jgi:hypothetical protein
VNISRPQETITINITNKKDLDKISSMRLDLLLPQGQQKKSKLSRVYRTEPLLVYELPVKVQRIIPIKEATVKVNLITVTLIKNKQPLL